VGELYVCLIAMGYGITHSAKRPKKAIWTSALDTGSLHKRSTARLKVESVPPLVTNENADAYVLCMAGRKFSVVQKCQA